MKILEKKCWKRGLIEASKNNDMKNVQYFLNKGVENCNLAFYEACKTGNKFLIDFLYKYVDHDSLVIFPVISANYDHVSKIVDHLVGLGISLRKYRRLCITSCIEENYLSLIQYFVSQEENIEWNFFSEMTKIRGKKRNKKLSRYFRSKLNIEKN